MKWLNPAVLPVLALFLASPALAGDVEGSDPDSPEAEEAPDASGKDDEAATLPDAPEASEAAVAAEAPVVQEPWLATPGEAAVEAVGVALDRIAALELLLAAGDGLDLDVVGAELDATRVALRLALVELGRLRQDEDLRSWLLAQGIVEPPEEPSTPADDTEPTEPGLTPGRLRAVMSEIEAISFTEGKMQVVTAQLDTEQLTTEQASSLLELFGFSRDRVDLLVFFHPRIIDPENFDGLLSALKFESDRETVRNQVGALR